MITNEDFVNSIKEVVVKTAFNSVKENLFRPPGKSPALRLIKMSEWYNKLNDSEKDILFQIIQESVDTAVFGFLCVLDGVRSFENENKGELKLYYEKGNEKILLNDKNSEYLHDLL